MIIARMIWLISPWKQHEIMKQGVMWPIALLRCFHLIASHVTSAVITDVLPDGSQYPIDFTSCTLTASERNYTHVCIAGEGSKVPGFWHKDIPLVPLWPKIDSRD